MTPSNPETTSAASGLAGSQVSLSSSSACSVRVAVERSRRTTCAPLAFNAGASALPINPDVPLTSTRAMRRFIILPTLAERREQRLSLWPIFLGTIFHGSCKRLHRALSARYAGRFLRESENRRQDHHENCEERYRVGAYTVRPRRGRYSSARANGSCKRDHHQVL